MAVKEYKKRVADRLLADSLEVAGAVLVQGPKWCGKTTTCEQIARSKVMLGNPITFQNSQAMAQINISGLLSGDTPRLFDEWQTIPELWDAIRYEVDQRSECGQFILTGSAVPVESQKIHHSGVGRFVRLRMRPMSLWESGDSTGTVSLKKLFEEPLPDYFGQNTLELRDIAYLLSRGGWPDTLGKAERFALMTATSYVDAIAESDLSRMDATLRNPRRIRLLLRSLGRLQGTQAPISTIHKDMLSNDDSSLSEKTISSYLTALENVFIVEDMPAWSTNLRSKTAIRTSNNRYYVDPSIAVAALGVSPDKLMEDVNTLGLLFETMAVRDLRVYADAIDAKVYHYRDKDGLECDAVIERRDGSYGLIEIKLGGESAIHEAQTSLNKLQNKIDTTKVGEPVFRMVLTAVGTYALKLQDGTLVVPIGCLKD